jgi:CheY-like chemotaxis protein
VPSQSLERAGGRFTQTAVGKAFDLVLCDLDMPDQDGAETIGELRPLDPGVRVVALSGGRFSFPGPDPFLLGADGELRKPCGRLALIAAVERALGAPGPALARAIGTGGRAGPGRVPALAGRRSGRCTAGGRLPIESLVALRRVHGRARKPWRTGGRGCGRARRWPDSRPSTLIWVPPPGRRGRTGAWTWKASSPGTWSGCTAH